MIAAAPASLGLTQRALEAGEAPFEEATGNQSGTPRTVRCPR
jgi:hypothetical protein